MKDRAREAADRFVPSAVNELKSREQVKDYFAAGWARGYRAAKDEARRQKQRDRRAHDYWTDV